jgi:hypothetical protein
MTTCPHHLCLSLQERRLPPLEGPVWEGCSICLVYGKAPSLSLGGAGLVKVELQEHQALPVQNTTRSVSGE